MKELTVKTVKTAFQCVGELRKYHRSPYWAVKKTIRNRIALREEESLAFVCTDPSNTGDYASCLGVRYLAQRNGVELYCNNAVDRLASAPGAGRKWKMAIIGGGGLLQPVFEKFWKDILATDVPVVAFGIGINALPPHRPLVSSQVLELLSKRAIAIHVRDQFSFDALERSGCKKLSIGPCPSINLLNAMRPEYKSNNKTLLHVVHPADLRLSGVCLIGLRRKMQAIASDLNLIYVEINHLSGFNRSILDVYSSAAVVVTSRLHGCIFSYAMEKPFIAIECDMKTRGFVASHAPNGFIIAACDLSRILSTSLVSNAIKAGPMSINLEELKKNQLTMEKILEAGELD
jgi:polysaccharide pyruvyl transferase WcaK-like protein